MLNYVWLALLFLGIGTAVTTDLINQNENKYRNNEPLQVVINFPGPFEKNSAASYQATLEVKTAGF